MGQYCSCFFKNNTKHEQYINQLFDPTIDFNDLPIIKKIALKLPHGTHYIEYFDELKSFIKYDNINVFIKKLYFGKDIKNFIVYNDDTHKIGNTHTKKGHCKGILTWNNNKISFLCHSIPNFPKEFNYGYISDIEESELIYGQSLMFIEFNYDEQLLNNIINAIYHMDPHIYIESEKHNITKLPKIESIITVKISDNITYIVKSPNIHIDIYSEYICTCKEYNSLHLYVETWQRGHHIENNCSNITDIKKLKFEEIEYNESQDHSKWSFSENYFTIGDLNRMTSQYQRGGGLLLCNDKNVASSLQKLVVI